MYTLRVLALTVASISSPLLLRADDAKKSDRSGSESSSKEKDKKPDYAKLLVGKWVRTDGQYAGTTMELDKSGTYVTSRVPQPGEKRSSMPGTWKLDGETLAQTMKDRGYVTNTKVTVISLTETEFRFKNGAGQEATYERVVEKEKEEKKK
jgi:uncharacterized protein (TIGR03066 family)